TTPGPARFRRRRRPPRRRRPTGRRSFRSCRRRRSPCGLPGERASLHRLAGDAEMALVDARDARKELWQRKPLFKKSPAVTAERLEQLGVAQYFLQSRGQALDVTRRDEIGVDAVGQNRGDL